MIVADTNLVAYLLIEGDHTETARRVYARDPDWCMPPLWRSEWLNVLATSVRADVLGEDAAIRVWGTALRLFGRSEVEPGGEMVLKTALRYRISAYDAQFVAVAEREGLTLVTWDRRLAEACPGIVRGPAAFLG